MSEQSNQQSNQQSEQSQGPRRSGEQQTRQGQTQQGQSQSSDNPLQTEHGETSIRESVVSQVAGIAAQEVEGIRMGSGGSQRTAGLLGSITGGSGGSNTQGVSVEVGKEEAAVDLTATVEYGRSVPQLAEAVRQNVINRIGSFLGLRVTEVNIAVSGLFFADQEQSQQIESGDGSTQSSTQSSSQVS